ncbi:hypothetical protein N7491_005733 [Penicillium cf. griseofulvum]|uniref:Uncharacterized protein n=1 Tax=Penicillium cf. griseofulvum TaxID=2972120 RepID=A0A9W9M4Y3_9EURO|nr:hypothetical protein N7472_008414 [Penicillium cf. griseofulvum]KAJ5435138.1 hypothetical protein N7491_005733 [Penicillium cf. griseofulvum]KAJ5452970.1 hypothetical protein N7445_001153 [Penicillium cf. griseofulvum]
MEPRRQTRSRTGLQQQTTGMKPCRSSGHAEFIRQHLNWILPTHADVRNRTETPSGYDKTSSSGQGFSIRLDAK